MNIAMAACWQRLGSFAIDKPRSARHVLLGGGKTPPTPGRRSWARSCPPSAAHSLLGFDRQYQIHPESEETYPTITSRVSLGSTARTYADAREWPSSKTWTWASPSAVATIGGNATPSRIS